MSPIKTVFEIALQQGDLDTIAILFQASPMSHDHHDLLLTSLRKEVIRAQQWNEKSIKILELLLCHGLRINHYEVYKEGLFTNAETRSLWSSLRDISYTKGFLAILPSGNITMSVPVRKLCIEKGSAINEPNKNGI